MESSKGVPFSAKIFWQNESFILASWLPLGKEGLQKPEKGVSLVGLLKLCLFR